MITFLKRCWRRRWIRGVAWTFISLGTFLALFVVWVNWKGAHVWSEAQQRLREEKVTLDFRQSLSTPVPDSENFCDISLLRDLPIVVDEDSTKGEPAARRKALEALGVPTDKESASGAKKPSLARQPGEDAGKLMTDWSKWLREMKVTMPVTDPQNPAREILAALSYQDAAVAEMAALLDRPHAQFLPAPKERIYPEMLFSLQVPHYSALHRVGTGLGLRAEAAIQTGDAGKAHEATRILTRLSEATSQEPFLIGLMVSRSLATMATQETWSLCEGRAGTAEDFRKLQRDLEQLNFHDASLRSWQGELAAGADAMQYLKRSRDSELLNAFRFMHEDGRHGLSSAESFIPNLIPSGLFDMNAANMIHLELDYIIRPLRDRGWLEVMKLQPEMEERFKHAKIHWPTNLDKVFAVLVMPSAVSITSTCVHGQCLVNQAIIACALERHYAEHQSYPESLETLKKTDGKNLPLDTANGAPMKYRKTEDGRYKLWSVGFDLIDDGGKGPDKDAKGDAAKPSKAEYKGDWVWEYATSR